MQGVFGLHDRQGFEVFAYSFGPDDGSPYRQRIAEALSSAIQKYQASLKAVATIAHH